MRKCFFGVHSRLALTKVLVVLLVRRHRHGHLAPADHAGIGLLAA